MSYTHGVLSVSTRTSIPRLLTWFLISIAPFLSPFVVWDIFRKEYRTTLATVELTDWEWVNLHLSLVTLYGYLVINNRGCSSQQLAYLTPANSPPSIGKIGEGVAMGINIESSSPTDTWQFLMVVDFPRASTMT